VLHTQNANLLGTPLIALDRERPQKW